MDYKWYIVNSMSGSETSVCLDINKMALQNEYIKEAFVPTKKITKIVKGKKVEAEQKLFPAYVFVKMVCNVSTLDAINNLPKVLGFLGAKNHPKVVQEEEIRRMREKMLSSEIADKNLFEIGDMVKIIDGPFDTFVGTIDSRDDEKKILKISVLIFGRSTTIDIDYSKVEKI